MPEVALVERRRVRHLEMLATGDCLQHCQVTCARFVESCEQAIDDLHAAFGRDHQLGPRVARDDLSVTFDRSAFE